MTNPYRALCVELAEELVSEYGYCTEWKEGLPLCLSNVSELLTRARALLDQQEPQPEPEGPTDEEARELADDLGITRGFFDHECGLHISCADLEPFARAVLARWGRPTPQPPAAGEVAASLIELRSTVMALGQMGMCVAAKRIERAADLLQRRHPQPVAHVDVGIEWRPCVKLPITVHVRDQRPGETHSSTREGITPLRSNDLIMRGVQGEEYPIGRELFEQTYKLLPANALPTPTSEVKL